MPIISLLIATPILAIIYMMFAEKILNTYRTETNFIKTKVMVIAALLWPITFPIYLVRYFVNEFLKSPWK